MMELLGNTNAMYAEWKKKKQPEIERVNIWPKAKTP